MLLWQYDAMLLFLHLKAFASMLFFWLKEWHTCCVWIGYFVYERIWSYFPELHDGSLVYYASLKADVPVPQLLVICVQTSVTHRFKKLARCFLFNLLVMFLGQSRGGQNTSVSDFRKLPVSRLVVPIQIPGIRHGTV